MTRWQKRKDDGPGLFDALDAARTERDAALAQVEQNADAAWKEYAWKWLVTYLKAHAEFFPDDVWESGLARPRELRAFGALVMRARREGLIEKTERTRQRTRGHATAGVVWRSVVYQGETA